MIIIWELYIIITFSVVYESVKESICQEHFEKVCQINFVKKTVKGLMKKCYNPFEKVCDGTGPETCKTFHETSCTTKYEEVDPSSPNSIYKYGDRIQQNFRDLNSSTSLNRGKNDGSRNKILDDNVVSKTGNRMLGLTKCEKIPFELCGNGCRVVQKGEKCYNTEVDDVRNVPEEQCELNPRQSCQNVSKLVPKLKPVLECSLVPKEFCALKYGPPKKIKNKQKSIWCLDEAQS